MTFSRGTATKGTRSFIKIEFSNKVQTTFDEQCVFMDCVNRDWEGEIENAGDIVTIRGFGDITWANYSPDVTSITYATLAETSLDLVVDQMKYCAFKADDVDQHQVDLDILDAYGERAGISGRVMVDSHLYTGISAAVPVDNQIGSSATGQVVMLTKDNIYGLFCDLHAILGESKVFSATTQRPWIVAPHSIYSLMKQAPEFTRATALGDDVVRNGVVGEFAGFEVKVATNLPYNPAGTGTDAHYNILAGVNLAYSFAQQINTDLEDVRLENQFGDGKRALMVYGSKAVAPQGLAKLVARRAA